MNKLSLIMLSVLYSNITFAQVQSPKVVFNNTIPATELGIDPNSSAVLTDTSLSIACKLEGVNCVSSGATGTTNPPSNLTITPSVTTLPPNTTFNLNWTGNGTEVCYGVSPQNITGWTNQPLPPTQSFPGYPITLTSAGTYNFGIRCYNVGGSASATSANVVVSTTAPPPPPTGGNNYCAEYYDGINRPIPSSPAFTAHGFQKVEVEFPTIWQSQPGFTSGVTAGVPGNFMFPTGGKYLAIPYILTSSTASSGARQINLSYLEPQALGIIGANISVSISPCPGDFRPMQTGTTDIYLGHQCRTEFGLAGNMSATSVIGLSGCWAPPDAKMYINIATYDMFSNSGPVPGRGGPCISPCGVAMRNL
jgi:hypothetical protein